MGERTSPPDLAAEGNAHENVSGSRLRVVDGSRREVRAEIELRPQLDGGVFLILDQAPRGPESDQSEQEPLEIRLPASGIPTVQRAIDTAQMLLEDQPLE